MYLKDELTGIITRIAVAEAKKWAELNAWMETRSREQDTNTIIALASMAAARRALETAKEHLTAAERKRGIPPGQCCYHLDDVATQLGAKLLPLGHPGNYGRVSSLIDCITPSDTTPH